MAKKDLLKRIYLYIFTVVGLVLVISGMVGIINLGLKAWIFTEADTDYYYDMPKIVTENGTMTCGNDEDRIDYRKAENQKDAAQNIALLIVGIPLYLFHWRYIRKEWKQK